MVNKILLLGLLINIMLNLYSREKDSTIYLIQENFKSVYLLNQSDTALIESIEHIAGLKFSNKIVNSIHENTSFRKNNINLYLKNQLEDGSWNDIDYNDTNRSAWEPLTHAERILEMVQFFLSSGMEYYKSPLLENSIHKAINYWFCSGLKSSNWWYNRIGVPRIMGIAFVLFEEFLSEEEHIKAIELMSNSKFGMTGQNKVWLAGNIMIKAILQNNINLLEEARNAIVSEIVLGKTEGIQLDNSYHLHGTQLQFGNYGLAYIYTMSLFNKIFHGTRLAFTDEHLKIIKTLIEDGYQWIVWNGNMDISTLGRQLIYDAPSKKAFRLLETIINFNDNSFYPMLQNCFSENNMFIGHKHFWRSDYTVSRRNTWMASLKMSSERVIGVESLNGDNLKGYYMADGALYIYKNSQEYYNIFPLWNWRRLPGVTAYLDMDNKMPQPDKKNMHPNKTNFVGGLSDGKNGISTMLLRKDRLKADKFWLFTDSAIICLGAGIESDSIEKVVTSVEQCWNHDNIKTFQRNHLTEFYGKKEINSSNLRVLHNGIGYIFIQNGNYCIDISNVTGDWHDIMNMYPEKKINGETFSLYINHGEAPKDASYSYIIIPEANDSLITTIDLSQYQILNNNRNIQAVIHNNICWASVKVPSSLDLLNNIKINFLTPGLYRVETRDLEVISVDFCDPTQALDMVSFLINNTQWSLSLPDDMLRGTTIKFKIRDVK